jgi:hypothetical protein
MNINVLKFSHKDCKDIRQERKVFTIKTLRALRFFFAILCVKHILKLLKN